MPCTAPFKRRSIPRATFRRRHDCNESRDADKSTTRPLDGRKGPSAGHLQCRDGAPEWRPISFRARGVQEARRLIQGRSCACRYKGCAMSRPRLAGTHLPCDQGNGAPGGRPVSVRALKKRRGARRHPVAIKLRAPLGGLPARAAQQHNLGSPDPVRPNILGPTFESARGPPRSLPAGRGFRARLAPRRAPSSRRRPSSRRCRNRASP
jgi:hypothetical protein